ncbi:MAG: hypothetical protein KIT89_05275 [Microcella sp.]|uniref:hypothetical protein n=1 Tax=Microcella sp. TaxID=1913979 RepID=UPI0024C69977|nr:hypothetical protein [Microcella sp.]UYN84588.1 MAG: hypothetical protein KIT89_05275 [Microcella sp.]
MATAPRWIAITAASALGIGALASGAVGIANAVPLVDSMTTAEVPPISTVPGELKGSGRYVTLDGESSVEPGQPTEPASAPTVVPAPAPPAQPVAPQPASSVSPPSPASVDSAD